MVAKYNKKARYITLKRHIKFVWNCANTQVYLAKRYGKLTKDDYACVRPRKDLGRSKKHDAKRANTAT